MIHILRCLIYLALIGASCFVLGRLLPKGMFKADRPPFRLYSWERQGAFYDRLGIRRWKEKLPDMSAILPRLMPPKKLPREMSAPVLERMIQETCVAEWIHGLLCILGFGCVLIWKGVWGWVVSLLYFLGNLPYILIQRYNRPKLIRILQKVQAREKVYEKCDHFELQHGTGT